MSGSIMSPTNAQPWAPRYAPSLSKYDQCAQCEPKHVCVFSSPSSLPMHISCPACTHPMYHLPWQSPAPDQARPLLQRGAGQRSGGGGGGSRCTSIQLQPVGYVTAWQHSPGLMTPPLPIPACYLGCCPTICMVPAKPIIHAQFKSKCHTLTHWSMGS